MDTRSPPRDRELYPVFPATDGCVKHHGDVHHKSRREQCWSVECGSFGYS